MKIEKKTKRVVFTMGGKGGVGKTGLMVALAEWFEANEIPYTLLDLDTENKARGAGYLVYFALGAAVLTFIITHNVRSTISVVIVAGACGIAARFGGQR